MFRKILILNKLFSILSYNVSGLVTNNFKERSGVNSARYMLLFETYFDKINVPETSLGFN